MCQCHRRGQQHHKTSRQTNTKQAENTVNMRTWLRMCHIRLLQRLSQPIVWDSQRRRWLSSGVGRGVACRAWRGSKGVCVGGRCTSISASSRQPAPLNRANFIRAAVPQQRTGRGARDAGAPSPWVAHPRRSRVRVRKKVRVRVRVRVRVHF